MSGIAAVFLSWLSYLDLLLIMPALALGYAVIADERSTARRQAWAGIVCAAVGIVAAIAFTFVYLRVAVHLVHECHGVSDTNFRQCITSHL